jgi:hypothetical protein
MIKHRQYVGEHCILQVYTVIAAVYHRAILDAKRNRLDAIEFLDITAPDWREKLNQKRNFHVEVADNGGAER